jgi:hypothetical protein
MSFARSTAAISSQHRKNRQGDEAKGMKFHDHQPSQAARAFEIQSAAEARGL